MVEQVVKEIEELELSRDYAGKYSDYEDDDKQFRRQIKRPKGKTSKIVRLIFHLVKLKLLKRYYIIVME